MPQIKLGAEVRCFPQVASLDLNEFTLGGRRYLLLKLTRMGTLAQVSADALADKKDKGFAKFCLEYGLCQTVTSDAHNMKTRGPCLAETMPRLEGADRAENFACRIWENKEMMPFSVREMKKGVFGYY